MRRAKGRNSRTAQVDITPLIDVLFMLIIFFVLMASFVQGNITVELPSATGTPLADKSSVTVTVTKAGGILWDGKAVSRDELRLESRSAAGKEILIAGDKGSPYGVVAEVMGILGEEGIKNVGLLTLGGQKK